MTLEKTWKECLRMWKWIADTGLGKTCCNLKGLDTTKLKQIWLIANNYDGVYNDCFFCDYTYKHGGSVDPGECRNCPAQKVDKAFCCETVGAHWHNNPVEFYERLVKLDKKRLSKKGKR